MKHRKATEDAATIDRFAEFDASSLNEAEQRTVVKLALSILTARHRRGRFLSSPAETRAYLKLALAERKAELFGVVFLRHTPSHPRARRAFPRHHRHHLGLSARRCAAGARGQRGPCAARLWSGVSRAAAAPARVPAGRTGDAGRRQPRPGDGGGGAGCVLACDRCCRLHRGPLSHPQGWSGGARARSARGRASRPAPWLALQQR